MTREAQGHEQMGRWAEATAVYERLVDQALDEKSREAWQTAFERCQKEKLLARLFGEGVIALEKGNWQRAQRAFAQVVHGRPDYNVNGQLAARLLLRAVLQRSSRRYRRVFAVVFLPTLLVVVAGALYLRPWRENGNVPPVRLPDYWEHVRTYRLDTNRDARPEWVVLYRFDLPAQAEHGGSPIAGVVYQSDDKSPSSLVSYELRPQDGGYLCECECTVAMEDVLSGLSGPELVVRDRCDGDITRLSIFYWDPGGKYLAKGHFSGSRVEIESDQVMVDQRLPHRAQFVLRQVYRPDDGETYYGPFGQGILVMPGEYELAFYHEEPRDVMRSPYPEKVVLAFYNRYTKVEQAADYFTREGWARLEQCAAGRCGCTSALSEVVRVRVTNLQPGDDLDPDRATFDVSVICERQSGDPEDETLVRWHLVRQDDRWKLDDAEVISTVE